MPKYIHIIFIYLLLCSFTLPPTKEPNMFSQIDREKMNQWVDSVFDSMSFNERVGQLFVLGVDVNLSARNKELIRKYVQDLKIGGILFTKGTVKNQVELTNYSQSLASIPLMITLDGEWGLSMRLTDAPRFPINMTLGAITNDSLIYAYGKEVGRQCRRMGIHVNFAPVLDVNSNENNPVIGRRSFGEVPEAVAQKGIAYARGIESEGVLSVAKHFPGHGDTSEDSHKTLPTVNHSLEHLEKFELLPFRRYINAGLSGMMIGHLHVPALDPYTNLPASLSPSITDTLLQQKMKFKGLVFTDGLEMKGASDIPGLITKALLAGNDMFVKPLAPETKFKELLKAISDEKIPHKLIEEKCLKILRYKYILGLNKPQYISLTNLEQDLNTPQTERLKRQLIESSITVLSDSTNMLPLKKLDQRKIGIISVGQQKAESWQNMIGNYTEISAKTTVFSTSKSKQQGNSNQLADCNTLIVGIFSNKVADAQIAENLCKGKKPILVFFISPYQMKTYSRLIKNASAVVLAYENNDLTQEYAAQVLFGGYGARGKIPVTVKNLYTAGNGIKKQPSRLGYTIPEEVGMNSRTLSQIDAIVKEGIENKAFPGCQILVAHKGKVIYNRSFGAFDYAGTHPVTNTDLYDIASLTKAAATIPAVMELYNDHKIGLNQKLSRYIPQLNKNKEMKQITVKDALFHETGLPPIIPIYPIVIDSATFTGPLFKGKRDANYRIQIDNRFYANKNAKLRKDLFSDTLSNTFSLKIAEHLYTVSSLPDTIFNRITHIVPSENRNYKYSCLNFILLQKAVENITGQPIDKFLEKNVYRPLGAYHTMYHPLESVSKNDIAPTENDEFLRHQILIGYPHDELAAFTGGVSGNAGLFSNANDLAKLLQMWLNKGEYGNEQYVSEHTVEVFTKTNSNRSRRGLGFDKPDIDKPNSSPTCEEAPASVYGHTGFTGTAFWVDPENDLLYIFLSNRVYAHRWNSALMTLNIRPRIQSIIYKSMVQ